MMVGWYLDVLVGYLIRIVIRMMKARGSGTWPVEKGTVTGSSCDAAPYGGPSLKSHTPTLTKGNTFPG
jgi:hypothetical protein